MTKVSRHTWIIPHMINWNGWVWLILFKINIKYIITLIKKYISLNISPIRFKNNNKWLNPDVYLFK